MSKTKAPTSPRLVADDNGYADHKLAWLDSNGKIMTLKVASMIAAGSSSLASTTGARQGAYILDGVEYTCSPHVGNPLDLRTSDYPTSAANRVLFTHGLARAGLLGCPLDVAVTLPFRDFFNVSGAVNQDLKARTQENFLRNDVEVVDGIAKPDVKSVGVYAEALSAWFDWAMDDEGNLKPAYHELVDMEGSMLIVDIGGSTTDLASIQISNETTEGQMLIAHAKSGTQKVGVLDARDKLEELMRTRMTNEGVDGLNGHDGGLQKRLISIALEKGEVSYSGQKWNFAKERDLACKAVAERITQFITSKVGNPASYFAILVVGGGSVVFQDHLKKVLPKAVFSDEFANARGALKFLIDKRSR